MMDDMKSCGAVTVDVIMADMKSCGPVSVDVMMLEVNIDEL